MGKVLESTPFCYNEEEQMKSRNFLQMVERPHTNMNMLFLIITLIFLCLALYGIYFSLRIQKLLHISRELVQNTLPYQRTLGPEAPQVLFLGDSTGVGVGADTPLDSLAGRFGTDHPEWTIDNLSVSGQKTAELLPTLKVFPEKHYAQVILQIGGNDIVAFSEKKQLQKNIAAILQEAKRVGKEVTLLTSGNVGSAPIFPRPFAFLWTKRTLLVREIFKEEARKASVTYIDLYRDAANDPFVADPYRYHANDLFHPSSAGYALWYTALRQTR